MDDVTVVVGGIIPGADIPILKEAGISEIFLPGTSTQAIIDFIQKNTLTINLPDSHNSREARILKKVPLLFCEGPSCPLRP